MMMDLQATLNGLCLYEHEKAFLYAEHGKDTISFPLTLVKEAIERAIKAEAEVGRLKAEVNRLTNVMAVDRGHTYQKIADDIWQLQADLNRYKRALELACRQISDYALPTGTETMKGKLAAGRYDVFLKEGAK